MEDCENYLRCIWNYRTNWKSFEGPLDLLLHLIEKKQK